MIIKSIIRKIKMEFFPSKHQLAVKKWRVEGGETSLRYKYDLNRESIVLDLGGYKGQWASDIFSRYTSNIYIFEPVKKFAEEIKKRFNKNEKILVFQYGLGASTRKEKLYLSDDGSSIFHQSVNYEEIKIVDVKEWINENRISKIDLIKINIEGGEYELLRRLIDTNLIDKIINIQVQFHKISKSSLIDMQNLRNELSKTHEPTYQYDFVWENWIHK